MATFSVSGSGTHSISAGTGALHVHVDTLPLLAGIGSANPPNLYHVGFLRFGDGTGWWEARPIDASDAWIGVPNGTTILGYSIGNPGAVTITEVAGAHPFSGPAGAAGAAGATGPAGASGSTLITRTVLTSSAANFTFSSIPATYHALHLVVYGRCDKAGIDMEESILRFNGDSGNNYDACRIYGNTGAPGATDYNGISYAPFGLYTAATSPAGAAALGVIDIPNYAQTALQKVFNCDGFCARNTSGTNRYKWSYGGSWRNTAAITSIVLSLQAGSNWVAGSSASLYGVS